MQVNIFDGYAIYALKENKADDSSDSSEAADQNAITPPAATGGGTYQ